MHHDHYISLPALLFYYNHTGGNLENLTIVGPSEDIETITNSAINFINAGKWNYKRPKIVKLEDYGSYETDDMLFETVPAIHGVQGLCYRITDNQTGKVICATGDTTQNDRLPDFFKGCDLLIHEISLGMQEELGGAHNKYGHSTVQEAVTLANHTDAKELFFVHHSRNHEAAIMEYAQAHLIGQKSGWPQIGKLYSLS